MFSLRIQILYYYNRIEQSLIFIYSVVLFLLRLLRLDACSRMVLNLQTYGRYTFFLPLMVVVTGGWSRSDNKGWDDPALVVPQWCYAVSWQISHLKFASVRQVYLILATLQMTNLSKCYSPHLSTVRLWNARSHDPSYSSCSSYKDQCVDLFQPVRCCCWTSLCACQCGLEQKQKEYCQLYYRGIGFVG